MPGRVETRQPLRQGEGRIQHRCNHHAPTFNRHAHPLIRMLLGRDVRQPTADVFAVSGELVITPDWMSSFSDRRVPSRTRPTA